MGQHDDSPTERHEFTAGLGTAPGAGTAAVIETAQQAAEPKELDPAKLYAVVGADGGVYGLDLERLRGTPDRPRGVYKPATVASFEKYVERWQADQATIWVHPTEGKIRAVLDDHEPGERGAGWGEHRAELDLIVPPEWAFWLAKDRQLMPQGAFADHIEEGVRQIVAPDAATMLELAQSFHASTDATFRSRVVLASGEVRMAYDEKIDAQAGQDGSITIPQEFELAISPFVGEDPYKVMARFRYRVGGGDLTLGYALIEPELVVRDCLEKIAERLTERFSDLPVLIGEPAQKGEAGR
jgi:uncharacterized protein YfdQ (DUF2303 family)